MFAFTAGVGGLGEVLGETLGFGEGRGVASVGRGVAATPSSPLSAICATLFLLISRSKFPFAPPLRTFICLPFIETSRLAAFTLA